MSAAITQKRKTLLETINAEGFKKQMALALPKHFNPDRMLRIALTAMNKTPKLYDCDPNTVLACLMDCSQLGLEPDGRNAYLIPFGNVCTLIIGYQGFIELAYRHPLVKGIRAKAVYEKDHFIYDEGLTPRLEHRPYEGEDDPGALKYSYAICNLDGGGNTFIVLNKRAVMKAKASSKSANGKDSPWKIHEEAMWIKTAVRRLAAFMPRSYELTDALAVDDRTQAIDIESITTTRPLFAGTEGKTAENENQPPADEASDGKRGEQKAGEPAVERATPARGLENLMKASGVSPQQVLGYLNKNGEDIERFDDVTPEVARVLINKWADFLPSILEEKA